MTSNDQPVRGRQVKPTQRELDAAWSRLREQADAGNLIANGLLIALTGDRSNLQGRPELIAAAAEIGALLVRKIQTLPEGEQPCN